MSLLTWLDPGRMAFPDPSTALAEPSGLLAAGGDLSVERLEAAYRAGIFPWFEDGSPILWWSPDPRAVIRPGELRVSRSLRKRLKRDDYRVTADEAFEAVVAGCAAPREDGAGTWITNEMDRAYTALHDAGLAHSIEVWIDGDLAGGLYGVAIGRCFFGESMFTRVADTSKIAFTHLLGQLGAWGWTLVDCQLPNPHLTRLGVHTIPRTAFLDEVRTLVAMPARRGAWTLDWDWRRDEGPSTASDRAP